VSLDGDSIIDVPLVALEQVEQAGLWTRLKDELMLWLE
jgi:hypothetical protein